MPGHLPPQCAIHPGFLARSCAACELASSNVAFRERPHTAEQRAHLGRTSGQSKASRAQSEADAAERREDYARQEAASAMRGQMR